MNGHRLPIGRVTAAMAVATGCVVLAFLVPVEPTDDGGRTLEGWWVAMAGIAAAVPIACWPTPWRRAGLLAGLFVLGLAAQLGLTFPHWAMSLRVTHDHFWRPEHYLGLVVLAVQAGVVLGLAGGELAAGARFVASALTPLRITLAVVLFVAIAANVAAYYPELFDGGYTAEIYARWLVAAGAIFVLNLALLWQIGRALPDEALARTTARVHRAISLPGDDGPDKPLDRRLAWYLAAFVLGVTAFLARVVLDGTAQFGDEVGYQLMAETLSTGRLRVPAPPVPEAFEMYLVEARDGMRYGVFIAGWPLVLAIGSFFGVPWLVNPVLGALSIPAAHALASRLADRGTANVVVVLMATSPWLLILSSVYQPHAVTLLAALLAWLGVHRAKADRSVAWALAAGLAAGVAFSVRPLDGLVIGGAGGLYALMRLGAPRAAWSALGAYVMGCVATGAVSLWVNYALTGDPLTYAMNAYFDREWGPGTNRLRFGADIGQVWGGLDPIPGHGWRDVLFNLNLNLFTLNYELFGWGVGSLFLVTVHLLWGRLTTLDRAWLVFIVGAVAVYSLYWFNGGPDYGPRYWYSTLFPLVFLSVRGLVTLTEMLRTRLASPGVGSRVAVAVVLLCLGGVSVFGSWRFVSKYVDYRSKTPLFENALESGAFGAYGLVIVDADGDGEYAALELNDLVPGERGPLFARDLGPETTAALMQAFPGRPVYRATLRITPDGKILTVTPIGRPAGGDGG